MIDHARELRRPLDPEPFSSKWLAFHAAQTLRLSSGSDVAVYDVRETDSIADYYVMASGIDRSHLQEMATYLINIAHLLNIHPLGMIEGGPNSALILIDFGHSLIFLFDQALRDYYGTGPQFDRCLISSSIAEQKEAERRKHLRWRTGFVGSVMTSESEADRHFPTIREVNLSAGGMRFITEASISLRAHLHVELVIGGSELSTRASVLWIHRREDGRHEVGARFEDISANVQEWLDQEIREASQEGVL